MNAAAVDKRLEARRTAAKFLASREAGWTSAEAEAYATWRSADFEHERAATEMEATDRRLRELHRVTGAADLMAEADALAASAASRHRLPGWLQVAVPFAIAAAVVLLFTVRRPHPAQPTSIVAAQSRMVDLSDGSTLRMDTGAEVAVQFRPEARRIELRKGSVHFAVAKDAARPFIVAAGDVHVRAVGTAFDVRYGETSVEVMVTEGKVAVTRTTKDDGRPPLFLVAGEHTALMRERLTATATSVSAVPPGELVTKSGAPRLEFSDTPLADVVQQFNRYSRVQLEVGDSELATRPVGGTFDADRADVFVDLLASSGDIRVERISETHAVLRKAR
jgi:transmembrane sensor